MSERRAGEGRPRVANEGSFDLCARCGGPLHAGTPATRCPQCGALYHESCYEGRGCIDPACAEGSSRRGKRQPRARRARDETSPGIWLLGTLGVVVALALAGVSLWYVLRPAAAAARAFDAGLRAQVAGDLDAARESFEAALERRPDMAEAALSLGFACLGFHGVELREGSIRDLFERARRGRTADLDAADAAFGRCIAAASKRPLFALTPFA